MMKSTLIFMPLMFNIMLIMIMMNMTKSKTLHPMILMLMLFFSTFIISLKMNYMYKSWMSFIIFLVIIGGLMIIFMYIISLINNNKFSINYKTILMNIMKILPMMFIMIFMMLYFKNLIYLNSNPPIIWNKNLIWDQINMNSMYTYFFNKSTTFIMIYLYYSMICIMNICIKFKIPLRQIMTYE